MDVALVIALIARAGSIFSTVLTVVGALHNQFLDIYLVWGKSGKEQAALRTTLYVFAQFFGRREIIRREIQFLRF